MCVSPYSRAPCHSSFVDESIQNLYFSVNEIHNGIQLKCGPVGVGLNYFDIFTPQPQESPPTTPLGQPSVPYTLQSVIKTHMGFLLTDWLTEFYLPPLYACPVIPTRSPYGSPNHPLIHPSASVHARWTIFQLFAVCIEEGFNLSSIVSQCRKLFPVSRTPWN